MSVLVGTMDKHILAERCHFVCTDNHYVVFKWKLYTNTYIIRMNAHGELRISHIILGQMSARLCERMHACMTIDLNRIVVMCRNESDNSI